MSGGRLTRHETVTSSGLGGGGVFPLKRLGEAGRHESGAAVGWGKADRVAV